MNTVLTMARVYNRNEIATLTDAQRALHTAKLKDLLNVDRFGVVEVVDRPQWQHIPLDTLVSKQILDGSYSVRLVARGIEQMVSSHADVYAEAPKLKTLRGLLTIAAIHVNPVAFEIVTVRFITHQCRVNQNQCMWSQHQKRSWTLPKYGFAGARFKDSRFLLRPGVFTPHNKFNDVSYDQLISDPSAYVKKRTLRSDDSILLRRMDDVVGTGPEEYLMKVCI